MEITKLALTSAGRFLKLVLLWRIHLNYKRVGNLYKVEDGGAYKVFRETYGDDKLPGDEVTLVVGFRLKIIGSVPFLHYIFQRICILTTPFWSGFRGFRIKLWMVDPDTMNYLGIYKWAGESNAKFYADSLVRILRPLSTPNSVYYKIHQTKFNDYLNTHKQNTSSRKRSGLVRSAR